MNTSDTFNLFLRGLIVVGVFAAGLCVEHWWPLRKATRPKFRRVIVNLGIAVVGAISLRLVFFPVVLKVSQETMASDMGLLALLNLPTALETVVAILLLDYTLYVWHWMNHKIPFLWRFHNAHHIDLDLDVSTASRFHFGELILSAGFRSAQVVLFGIGPYTLILFEMLVTTAAQFHHSNVRLPFLLEKWLNRVIVTPRMHGIHHSIVRMETDSNFSTIFSFWDHLHRSIRLNVPQAEITIGVASYRDPKELGFVATLLAPFRRQRAWKLPDGGVPMRESSTKVQENPRNQLIA